MMLHPLVAMMWCLPIVPRHYIIAVGYIIRRSRHHLPIRANIVRRHVPVKRCRSKSKCVGHTSLYLNVKKMPASWTPYAVLSLFTRQTKGAFALGTFFVDVGFSVAPFVFQHYKRRFNFSFNLEENLVFSPPFVNISWHNTKYWPNKEGGLNHRNCDKLKE